jgi:hypothetical protein
MTFEDGMISCESLQLGFLAMLLPEGEEKKNLTIEHLLGLFETASGSKFTSDKEILSKSTKG